jgi:hypothetical protein
MLRLLELVGAPGENGGGALCGGDLGVEPGKERPEEARLERSPE